MRNTYRLKYTQGVEMYSVVMDATSIKDVIQMFNGNKQPGVHLLEVIVDAPEDHRYQIEYTAKDGATYTFTTMATSLSQVVNSAFDELEPVSIESVVRI